MLIAKCPMFGNEATNPPSENLEFGHVAHWNSSYSYFMTMFHVLIIKYVINLTISLKYGQDNIQYGLSLDGNVTKKDI
jgi:hypothetical protein